MYDFPQDFAGREYTIIGWCRNKTVLKDQESLKDLLKRICLAIDMRPLVDACVDVEEELKRKQSEKFEDEGGSSASLILSTSHANIHGWPYRDPSREDGGFFWFTIGSCRDFDTSIVDLFVEQTLLVSSSEKHDQILFVPCRAREETSC